ncbi:MAG TPA: DUF1444 family protein, partial [Polyangiales bacterium]
DDVDRVELQGDEDVMVWMEGEEKPRQMFVGALFRETRDQSPEDKQAAIDRFLRVLASTSDESAESWEETRSQVMAVVRSAVMGTSIEVELVSSPFLPCLSTWVVVDSADSMRYVSEKDLESWGVEADTVLRQALDNLQRLEHGVESYGRPDDGVWHLMNSGTYESSCLLMPALLDKLTEVYGGPLAFAAPERASLLFARVDDEAALARLQEVAEREFQAAARPLSPDLYVRGAAARLVPLQVAPDHPLREQLQHARVQFVGGSYQEQKQVLEQRFEREERDVYVAAFAALQRDDGTLCSYCVWGENVASLLPETDLVFLAGGRDEARWTLEVRWADLLAAAGDVLEPTHAFGPLRWETSRWLSAAELRALGRG